MLNLSNIKMALRNARKNSALSFAKLFGISISFAVILFAAGYVYFESSFDKFIPDKDKIFRVYMKGRLNGEDANYAVTSAGMADIVTHEIPDIKDAVRIFPGGKASLSYNDVMIDGGQLYYGDSNFFSFFGLPVKRAAEKLFTAKINIAMSESLATKIFGNSANAFGKMVKIGNQNCLITGIFPDLPKNFHLQFQVLQSIEQTNPEKQPLTAQNYYTYIKTKTNHPNIDRLDFQLTKSVYSHGYDELDGTKAKTWDDLKFSPSIYIYYKTEPLTSIHFSSHKFDPAVTSNKIYIIGAIILAFLVLLISSINFTNLTIANLSTRLKEIGIRKTSGAFSGQIAQQFLNESFIFWLIGFFLSIVIFEVAGKPLAHYLHLNIEISRLLLVKLFFATFILLIIFNLITNVLPIYFISKRKVLNLLKNEKTPQKHFPVKNGLIFFQFALSAIIILGSVIVQKQINYMADKNRGYDANNILMFRLPDISQQERESFIHELSSYTDVKDVATSDIYFGKEEPYMTNAFVGTEDKQNYFHTSVIWVDNEFLKTFDLKMARGRYFDKNLATDNDAVIINETAAWVYSGKGQLIGNTLILPRKTYHIVGIVKDFNFRSLYHPIEPLVMLRIRDAGNIFVKFRNQEASQVTGILQKLWKEYEIPQPLQYQFHNQLLAEQYTRDQQAKKLLLILSLLSISIACVGLYAISLFTIINKTKEIGIRKVNGASIQEVMTMLNKDFLKWVAIAFVVATPIAWFAMTKWLENFAYRTALSWWIFALSGTVALGIALLTISWQSWKAATRNPVEALRYE